MAKYFIYPRGETPIVAAIASGTFSGGSNDFATGTQTTNPERLGDSSITTAANFASSSAVVRWDKGSGSIDVIDSIAFYSTAANSNGFKFYTNSASDSATASFQWEATAVTVGWNVNAALTAGNAERYWYMSAHEGAVATVTEFIFGVKLSLTNVDLNGTEGINYGNDIMSSDGGEQYSNQRHGGKRFWNFDLRYCSSAYKTSLQTMRDAVKGAHYKFLYYDGSAYYYVRMSDDSLIFKEIAYGVYDTSIKLTEVF